MYSYLISILFSVMAGKLMYCSFRYVTDDNPSDLLIRVGGTNFHLHQVCDASHKPTVLLLFEILTCTVLLVFISRILWSRGAER